MGNSQTRQKHKLFDATMCGQLSRVTRVVEKKKLRTVDVRNEAGLTPLMVACYFNHFSIVMHLATKCGANVNATDDRGWTPVMIAADRGHLDIVKFLVTKCFCNLNIRNKSGRRVFDLVEQHPKVRAFLLSHDPEILVKNSQINNSRSDTSVSSDVSDEEDEEEEEEDEEDEDEDEEDEEEEDLGYDRHHLLLAGKMHELDLEQNNGDAAHQNHPHALHYEREDNETDSVSDLTESPTYY